MMIYFFIYIINKIMTAENFKNIECLKINLPNNNDECIDIKEMSNELERISKDTNKQNINTSDALNNINDKLNKIFDVLSNHKNALDNMARYLFRK